MMRNALIMTLSAACLLAGCAPASTTPDNKDVAVMPPKPDINPEPPMAGDEADKCGASLVASYVGRVADDVVRAEIAAKSGATSIRWVTPGMMVTMDYRTHRLNVSLTGDNIIKRVHCA